MTPRALAALVLLMAATGPAYAAAPNPEQPDESAIAAIDDARANATSPAAVPAAAGLPLPATLNSGGKAIDPLCFAQTWEQPADGGTIDLGKCAPADMVRVPPGDGYKPGKGAHGIAYRPADISAADMPVPAFIEYKYLGDAGMEHAVLLSESGGGTGMFTSLFLLHRDGEALRISRTVAGGDRCNNGLRRAAVENGTLSYEVNLTPAALYDLAGFDSSAEMPGGPLKDCAVCCYATATYRGDDLVDVRFAPGIAAALSPDESGTSGCFDSVIGKYATTILTPEKLAAVGAEIQNQCIAAATP